MTLHDKLIKAGFYSNDIPEKLDKLHKRSERRRQQQIKHAIWCAKPGARRHSIKVLEEITQMAMP